MKRSEFRSLLLSLTLMGAPAAAQAPLHVDITQGVAAPLPIAVPEVASGAIAGMAEIQGAGDLGIALSQIVRDDLLSAGIYRLVRVDGGLFPGQEVVLAPYMAAGAQALVIGRAQAEGDGRLAYECQLRDVFSGRVEASRRFLVSPAQWRRAAHQCADLVYAFTTGDPGHFDTRLLYVADDAPGDGSHLVATDYDGANAVSFMGDRRVAMPAFSPDSRKIIFVSYQQNIPQLVVVDLDSGLTMPLATPTGMPSAPRFSPDGRSVVFSLARDGDADIYRIDLGSGAVRQLTDTTGADTSPSFSPDGTSIVFESDRSGQQQLYVMAADGSGQRRISFGGGAFGSPAWSPRDGMITFTHNENGKMRIGIMKSDGSARRFITEGPYDEDPYWALSGRAVAFQRSDPGSGRPALWITDLTGKVQHRVRTAGSASDPAWSGKRP